VSGTRRASSPVMNKKRPARPRANVIDVESGQVVPETAAEPDRMLVLCERDGAEWVFVKAMCWTSDRASRSS